MSSLCTVPRSQLVMETNDIDDARTVKLEELWVQWGRDGLVVRVML